MNLIEHLNNQVYRQKLIHTVIARVSLRNIAGVYELHINFNMRSLIKIE